MHNASGSTEGDLGGTSRGPYPLQCTPRPGRELEAWRHTACWTPLAREGGITKWLPGTEVRVACHAGEWAFGADGRMHVGPAPGVLWALKKPLSGAAGGLSLEAVPQRGRYLAMQHADGSLGLSPLAMQPDGSLGLSPLEEQCALHAQLAQAATFFPRESEHQGQAMLECEHRASFVRYVSQNERPSAHLKTSVAKRGRWKVGALMVVIGVLVLYITRWS